MPQITLSLTDMEKAQKSADHMVVLKKLVEKIFWQVVRVVWIFIVLIFAEDIYHKISTKELVSLHDIEYGRELG